jgi:hypothetical protein
MNRHAAVLIATIVTAIGVACITYVLGSTRGVESMTVKFVSPQQVALAMKNDEFYTDYRENTLVIKGVITSIYKTETSQIVTFKTSGSFGATCDMWNAGKLYDIGQTLTVITEGGAAVRQPHDVLLSSCTLP